MAGRRGTGATAVLVLLLAIASPAVASARHAAHRHHTRVGSSATGRVLLVGTYQGIHGGFASIQSAVDAAHAGDWILVAPGDYHEQGVTGADEPAGVLVRTPWIHLRGMDRNTVIVDGTKPGAAPCSARAEDQQVTDKGRNGIDVFKADGVYVQNLTSCNFLTNKDGEEGNEIWWNGGDGSGKIGMGP